MKILFFSSQLIFAGTRFGGAKRLYAFARELAKRHEVYVMCIDGCREMAILPADTGFAHYLALPDADRHVGAKESYWRLPVDVRGGLERERPRWQAFLGDTRFDAVVLAFPFGLSFLDIFPRDFAGPIVYIEDDLYPEFLRLRIAKGQGPLRRLSRRLRYHQALGFYRRNLLRVSTYAGISTEEIAIMGRLFPGLKSQQLRYGIEAAEHPTLPPQSPLRMGFIGNFLHVPNADGLAWLLESIWPVLRKGLPGARLFIAGVGFPSALREKYAADADIAWMENVPRLEDFYREIGVFLNPIVSGRGMRTKLIEAAAYGRPLISTALGAEGVSDLRIEIAETPEAFLTACRRLAQDEYLRTGIAAGNRARIESAYDIAAVTRELEALLRTV